ncbi:MAG: tRNA lysidine(34) synthetase TilS [Pseudomonadota bacterium]
MRGLDLPALDRRLRTDSSAPLAVAFSGGGDSLALLLAAKAWAEHSRRLLVLTVDHGLNSASAGWTVRCGETAARLGVDFRALRWDGPKPATGLPAAARAARHALLADAARVAGAKVILMGHTADDIAEGAAMRAEGSTVSDPAEWAPSPAWPEGRHVFLLRPMLGLRREALRAWLRDRGESWIDDPANEDVRFARARARNPGPGYSPASLERGTSEAGGGESAPGVVPRRCGAVRRLSSTASGGPLADLRWGGLALSRAAPAAHIAAACLCAGGTGTPPRGDKLDRLVDRIRADSPFTATLGGARIEADGDHILFIRNAGETARGGLAPLDLPPGRPVVWDGRYELTADTPGLTVRALAGLTRQLPRAEQAALRAVPASARPSLPVIDGPDGPTCPILATPASVRCRALILTRFEAATGVVDREPPV